MAGSSSNNVGMTVNPYDQPNDSTPTAVPAQVPVVTYNINGPAPNHHQPGVTAEPPTKKRKARAMTADTKITEGDTLADKKRKNNTMAARKSREKSTNLLQSTQRRVIELQRHLAHLQARNSWLEKQLQRFQYHPPQYPPQPYPVPMEQNMQATIPARTNGQVFSTLFNAMDVAVEAAAPFDNQAHSPVSTIQHGYIDFNAATENGVPSFHPAVPCGHGNNNAAGDNNNNFNSNLDAGSVMPTAPLGVPAVTNGINPTLAAENLLPTQTLPAVEDGPLSNEDVFEISPTSNSTNPLFPDNGADNDDFDYGQFLSPDLFNFNDVASSPHNVATVEMELMNAFRLGGFAT